MHLFQRRRLGHGTLLALLCLLPGLAHGQGEEYVQEHYTKYEYSIRMRDGTRLFTAVYVPKDGGSYPILLTRTPYNVRPYGVAESKADLGPSPAFGKEKYIFAYQDVRGRWMSEGEFVNVRPQLPLKATKEEFDESTDTWDTIDWLVKNIPENNGKVGMWGISYPGFYTTAGMVDAHPALKAASPQAPVTDWFIGDDWHHNGAFFLTHAFNFLSVFGRPRPDPTKKFDFKFDHETPDGYEFFLRLGPLENANRLYFKDEVPFWNEVLQHGTYDEFWKARDIKPHLKQITPAVMTVGGWYDAENLYGALETYRAIDRQSPETKNLLVMGPWVHGGWSRGDGDRLGHVNFHAKTGEFFRDQIQFPFFQHYLKQDESWDPPAAWVFETGTNQWRKYDAWPPKKVEPHDLYLSPGGKLAWEQGRGSAAEFDEFVSDPAKPVPYFDRISTGMEKEYFVADQRFAARRPDVLVYQTPAFAVDVTLAGPIEVELHVSTTGTDADWIVKLIDVYPDDFPDPKENPAGVRMGGYQQLVRGDVMRGKFRNSFEKPEPFKPGEPTLVRFTLPDVYHAFRPGHRLMVQVQSSWFPLVDRNPQTFCDIYHAQEADYRKATHRVYHTTGRASKVVLPILP